jgi:ATP-dependent Clp protease ATP-binding subunit ClpA
MFDSYSIRAKQVIFLTRLESGARGAQMLDVDDLVAGLITEDQNAIPSALARLGMTGEFMNSPEHYPFLSPDIANSVLESIHQSLPRSQQVPISTDMPISPGLQQILSAASDLRKKLQSKEVTPLHLLAATMRGSHSAVQALRDAGITEERVQKAIEDQG